MHRLSPTALGLFLTLTAITLNAATLTWDGSASSNWADAANWSTNTVPTTGDSVVLTGAGSAPTNQNVAGLSLVSITINATATTAFTITGSGVTLTGATSITVDTAAANHTLSIPVVLGAATTWSIGTNRTFTVTADISETGGARSIIKTGAGTLNLSGNNTFSGGVTCNGGFVGAQSNNSLGTGTFTINATGKRLILSNGVSIPNAVTINGGSPDAGRGIVEVVDAGTATVSGTLSILGTNANGGHFRGANGLTFSGSIVTTPAVTVVIRTGTVRFSAANTLTAPVIIGGTLIAEPASGTLAFTTVGVGVSEAGTFRVNAGTVTANSIVDAFLGGLVTTNQTSNLQVDVGTLTVSSGLSTDNLRVGYRNTAGTSTGTLIVTGGTVLAGTGTTSTVDVGRSDVNSATATGIANFEAASSVTMDVGNLRVGTRTGDPGVTDGILRLSLAGTNTLTATTVQLGDSPGSGNTGPLTQVFLGNASNIINATTVLIGNRKSRAEMRFAGTGGTLTLNGRAGPGTTSDLRIGINNVDGTGTVTVGTLDLSNGTFNAEIGNLDIGLHNSGAGSGSGTLTFVAGDIQANAVNLARPDATGSSTNDANTVGTLNHNGGRLRFGTLQRFNGTANYNWNAGTLSNPAAGDGTNSNVDLRLLTASTHTFDVDANQSLTISATAQISSTGALTKTGAGTLVLSGANTYSGGTQIDGGLLAASNTTGSATGTGAVAVNAGGTLGGSGIVSGTVNAAGTIAPGVSGPGTLTLSGNVNFNAGSAYSVELDGAGTSDLLAVGGALVFNATANLSATAVNTTLGQSITIIDLQSAGNSTGTFNGIPNGGSFTAGATPFSLRYDAGTGNDCVVTHNSAPVFTAAATNTAQSIDEGETPVGLLATDGDGDTLTYTLLSGTIPNGLTFDTSTGVFTGTAAPDAAGVYNLVFRVSDTRNGFDDTTLALSVFDAGYSVADVSVAETAGFVTITVTRTGQATVAGSVLAATVAGGTASAPADYTSTSITLNWNAGETGDKTFTIPILDDLISEGAETIFIQLTNNVGAILGDADGVVTINDNEALPTLSVADASVAEAAGAATVTVTLSGPSAQPVSVDLATAGGTATVGLDYTDSSTTLLWLPGEMGARTILVPIIQDLIDEAGETVDLTLSNVSPSATILDGAGVLTVLDDDVPPAAVNDTFAVGQNTPRALNVLANDAGLANVPLTLTILTPTANGTLTVNPDNTVTYAPAAGYVGPDSFAYRVTDSVGQFSDASASINVTPAPVFTSQPAIAPNPAVAGSPVLGTGASDVGTLTWAWGDGSSSTGSSVSHTYAAPGTYTATITAVSPEGAVTTSTVIVFVSIGLDGTTGGGGGGGGATPPGVTGILVGGAGAGTAQGGSGKVTCNYVRREKTTYQGSIGRLALPANLTQAGLAAKVSTLTIGTGASAATFRFDLDARGKGKAMGLPQVEFNVKKKRFRFKAQRSDLTDLTEALGGPREFIRSGTPVTMLVPVTVRIGDDIFLALTFQVRYQQINNGGKGSL